MAQSSLLSDDEHETLSWMVGDNCQVLASTIAQMYVTKDQHHMKWAKHHAGVLCFVSDQKRKNFYLQMCCLVKKRKLWEQIVRPDLNYSVVIPPTHMLDGDDCKVAFNFRDDREAGALQESVFDVLRQLDTLSQSENGSNEPKTVKALPVAKSLSNLDELKSTPRVVKKKIRKKSLKLEIGSPQDFQHTFHVSLDKMEGCNIQGDTDRLKEFLSEAGITHYELRDDKLRTTICKFFQAYGGFKSVLSKQAEYVSRKDLTLTDCQSYLESTNGMPTYDSVKTPVRVSNPISDLYDTPMTPVLVETPELPPKAFGLYDQVKTPVVKVLSAEEEEYGYDTLPVLPSPEIIESRTYPKGIKSKIASPEDSSLKKPFFNKKFNPVLLNEMKVNLQKRLITPDIKKPDESEGGTLSSRPLPEIPDDYKEKEEATSPSLPQKPILPRKPKPSPKPLEPFPKKNCKLHYSSEDILDKVKSPSFLHCQSTQNFAKTEKPELPPKKEGLTHRPSIKKQSIKITSQVSNSSDIVDYLQEIMDSFDGVQPKGEEDTKVDLAEVLKQKIETRKSRHFSDGDSDPDFENIWENK